MRYTLSVLTAAGLLALGQPAWSEDRDREGLQRWRMTALSLPCSGAASAALLHAAAPVAPTDTPATTTRTLPVTRMLAAVQHMLQQHYGSALQAQALPPALALAPRRLQDAALNSSARPRLLLDTDMVTRWAAARQVA